VQPWKRTWQLSTVYFFHLDGAKLAISRRNTFNQPIVPEIVFQKEELKARHRHLIPEQVRYGNTRVYPPKQYYYRMHTEHEFMRNFLLFSLHIKHLELIY